MNTRETLEDIKKPKEVNDSVKVEPIQIPKKINTRNT